MIGMEGSSVTMSTGSAQPEKDGKSIPANGIFCKGAAY